MTRPSINKTTITVPQISVSGCGDANPARPVSAAAPPPRLGDLPRDDRQATAPRVGAIRCARQWREDPVLRQASKRHDRG
ncbi:MAG: hypothetical protein LCH92_08210 [Proteobacteria bacterium]|nr:hypothetical protein [Pseudomonadota bacterium]